MSGKGVSRNDKEVFQNWLLFWWRWFNMKRVPAVTKSPPFADAKEGQN